MNILAPIDGVLTPLDQVPDPVFATEMMGPGVAVTPNPGKVQVVAPVEGIVAALKPHAFIVNPEEGPAVLVHLGVNTVTHADLFDVDSSLVEGAKVAAGRPITSWDVTETQNRELPTHVAVVVIDAPDVKVVPVGAEGDAVEKGQAILELSKDD